MESYYTDHFTERMSIRPLEESDVWPLAEFFATVPNPEWIDIPKVTDPLRHSRIWIGRQLKRYEQKEYGILALTIPETKAVIGMAGLVTHTVKEKWELEIGYHLIPRFWGRGYATEAARYFKEFAFAKQLAPSVTSFMHKDNWPSRNVAIRNGMSHERDFEFRGLPCALYRVWANDI